MSTPLWLVLPKPPGATRLPMGELIFLLVLTGQMKPSLLGTTSDSAIRRSISAAISLAAFSSAA